MKRKHFLTILPVIWAIIIGLMVLNFGSVAEDKTWDTEFPMANVNVTWLQTHHNGAWSD